MATTTRRRADVVGLITLGMIGTPPALANDHFAALTGISQARSVSATVYNKDLKDDGQFTSTRYTRKNISGEEELVNKSGPGVEVNRVAGSIVLSVKACVSRTLLPMRCSGWDSIES